MRYGRIYWMKIVGNADTNFKGHSFSDVLADQWYQSQVEGMVTC